MKKASAITIGKNIQSIRKSYGYTQEKLAEAIEVSTRYISDIEQDNSKPSYEVLIRICNLFNISLNQVFSEYLSIEKGNQVNYSLMGFEKLNSKDKETIEHLIMYFNKSKKQVN